MGIIIWTLFKTTKFIFKAERNVFWKIEEMKRRKIFSPHFAELLASNYQKKFSNVATLHGTSCLKLKVAKTNKTTENAQEAML